MTLPKQTPKQPKDINELNILFQKYLTWYNQERLHFSLNFLTPAEKLSEYNKTISLPNVVKH